MNYHKMSVGCIMWLILLVTVGVVAEEHVEFRRPAVGSFAWQEMSSITAPVEGEPDSPDHLSQAMIVVRHHDDGGIDKISHGRTGLVTLGILRLSGKGRIVKGMMFPPKHEVHNSEAALLFYPLLPGRSAQVEESWVIDYPLDEEHALKGEMQLKGQITMQENRPWWVIDFVWDGNVNGIFGQPNPDPEGPSQFEYHATGKYAVDSVTSFVVALQAKMEYSGFMTFTMDTESLEFGTLPEVVILLLQQAYDALEQDKLDEAEAVLQQCGETAPEIPWLAGMSDGVKMPQDRGDRWRGDR